MRYLIDKKLKKIEDNEILENKAYVDLISIEEIKDIEDPIQSRDLKLIRRCRLDAFENIIAVTLDICDLKNMDTKKWSGMAYLEKSSLVLIGDVEKMDFVLNEINKKDINEFNTPGQVLFAVLEYMIRDDEDIIDAYTDAFEEIEDQMLDGNISENLEKSLLMYRKKISKLNRYYQQVSEMILALSDCPYAIVDKESHRLYRYLYNRVDLYYMEAKKLKEQLTSLRDHYQMMHNERQDNAVRILTIATSVFMPLTLLTGWYGMNFSKMPELTWEHGYEIVIGLAIVVLIVELYIFKKKKWL